MITVELRGNYFVCEGAPSDIDVLRGIPNRAFDESLRKWTTPRTRRAAEYLGKVGAHFSPTARDEHDRLVAGLPRYPLKKPTITLKTKPLDHQWRAMQRLLTMKNYALFMDPGLGKSKCLIDDAGQHFADGKVAQVLVVCPNSIKSNWVDEFDIHSPAFFDAFIYSPEKRTKCNLWIAQPRQEGFLRVLIIAAESLSHKSGLEVAERFLKAHPTVMAVDESSRFKTFNATRTKNLIKLSPLALLRRLATGTAITKGLQDAWSQFQILSPDILGMNYFSFRNRFCVMGGFDMKQIVASKNEDEFIDLISDFVFMATKEECLDLPPKVYEVRRVQPSDEMLRLYLELKQAGRANVRPGEFVTYSIAVVRDLRLQQITGGFVTPDRELASVLDAETTVDFSFDNPEAWQAAIDMLEKKLERAPAEPIPGANPKVDELLNIVEEHPGKIIIWCRFRPEITAVVEALEKAYPGSTVQFHGGIDNDTRTVARKRFQEDPKIRFFVGQQDSGGIGITLTAASTMVYFSNSWSLETRIQSEDRAHRVGQTKMVKYIDLLMEPPKGAAWVDEKVFRALKARRDYVAGVMEDISEATR